VAAAPAAAAMPAPAPALPSTPPPPVAAAPAAAPSSPVPLPPLPPLEKRPVETAAAPALPPPLPPAPPAPAAVPVQPRAEQPAGPAAAPAELAAVAPAEPVPPEPAPADGGFGAEDAAEDLTGVHEYASLAEVPDVVRQLAESLPECVPLEKGARRQPFGERILFSFACPAARPQEQERAFVLARDERGNGANVLMFPRPGGKAVEPLHELSNPRVAPDAREFVHTQIDPGDRPCRQQGRWRVDERGNAGLLGWRSSTSCDGAWTAAAASAKKDPPAAKSTRGSKKASAKRSSRSKGKATARKPATKKTPVKKRR
jgi:hypothetical protein